MLCAILDELAPTSDGKSYALQIAFVADRQGHDFRYGTDASKIERELGCPSGNSFQGRLIATVIWYLEH